MANPRLVQDVSDSRTSLWAVPGNRCIQNITAQWPASATGQIPIREFSAPNELMVSYRGEMYMDGLVTEHCPTFIAPTMPQIKLLGTEVSREQNSSCGVLTSVLL